MERNGPDASGWQEPETGDCYAFRVSRALDDPEWDAFLAGTSGGHHVQSSMWARLKAGTHWRAVRLLVERQGGIVAGAQLLIRRVASLISIAYLSKGPITAIPSLPLQQVIIRKVSQLARQNRVLLLAVQPPNNGAELAAHLPRWGFEASRLELAPVASLLLDLAPSLDQLLANMKRQTRQNIRRGEQGGLCVREGSQADLDQFYEFHEATSRRQGFPPYSREYYTDMWRLFHPAGHIKLFMAEVSGHSITGLLLVPFGDTVIAKILGWSGERPDLRPNDAVFWHAIRWSKASGYRYFDFEGIDRRGAEAVLAGGTLPAELQHSPDFFKLGYGGQVVLYPPTFEMIHNRLVRSVYRAMSPTVGGEGWASRLMDRLRKH